MPAKKTGNKKSSPSGSSTIALVLQAMGATRGGRKGVSRQAIANWILANTNKQRGARFNAVLRRCLATALENGVLVQGATNQRFKLGAKPAPEKKKAAKKAKKKKTASKQNKTSSKRKTGGKKKKTSKK